jgi:hypothetical protein
MHSTRSVKGGRSELFFALTVFAGPDHAWKSRGGRFSHALEEAEIALRDRSTRRAARVVKPRRNPVALARKWDALLADGTYSSRAELARGPGISRARATQVLNLLNLPKPVLDAIAALGDPLPSRLVTEHMLHGFSKLSPREQREALLKKARPGEAR